MPLRKWPDSDGAKLKVYEERYCMTTAEFRERVLTAQLSDELATPRWSGAKTTRSLRSIESCKSSQTVIWWGCPSAARAAHLQKLPFG